MQYLGWNTSLKQATCKKLSGNRFSKVVNIVIIKSKMDRGTRSWGFRMNKEGAIFVNLLWLLAQLSLIFDQQLPFICLQFCFF